MWSTAVIASPSDTGDNLGSDLSSKQKMAAFSLIFKRKIMQIVNTSLISSSRITLLQQVHLKFGKFSACFSY
jgi:hypothetical protein